MQEYGLKKGWKIGYFCNSLLLAAIMAYCVLYAEGFAAFLIGLIIFSFSALTGVAVFFDSLTLNDDFIEVKRLFRRKRIKIKEIINVVARHNQAFVNSERATIHITQDFVNWQKVVSELLRRVKQEKQNNFMPLSNKSLDARRKLFTS